MLSETVYTGIKAVINGSIITSRRMSASVLAVVFFLRPVSTFLGGVLQDGSLAAVRFSLNYIV